LRFGTRRFDGTVVFQRNHAKVLHTAATMSTVAIPIQRLRVRIAVISDIHGNFHALRAVLDVIVEERPGAIWCLGDTVGYGPKPNECCALVEQSVDLCLAGNHDFLALGKTVLEGDFNPEAASAGSWTAAELTADAQTFLGGLEAQAHTEGVDLYHGSARDPVWEYVLNGEAARATFALSRSALVLVGHSHIPLGISLEGERIEGTHSPAGTEFDLRGGKRWLCNPGSVGQPRDGDSRAAWLLLDLDESTASFRREDYDIEATQAEMRDAGLPEPLAERLTHGL
jgi:diadenosine tetraphosphatase ApaH/serine/threonine PP2A family protein phosphatase